MNREIQYFWIPKLFYMKFFLLFLFLLSITTVSGQTKSDYENAMAKFQQFYNASQPDSICAMFEKPGSEFLWNKENIAATLNEFGIMNFFEFIGVDKSDPNKVWVFKTVFSKGGEKATSLTLYKDKRLGTFRFMTLSEGITQLLKNHKK